MPQWPPQPVLHEVNTWAWLDELGRRDGRTLDLGCVPAKDWDAVVAPGVDAVWLMGVWERSPAGAQIARTDPGLYTAYRRALPDVTDGDVVGSPYAIHRYVVDRRLGGDAGLAAARSALAARGARLLVDFVPNHVARDHPWTVAHPEYFVRGSDEDAARSPGEFVRVDGAVLAMGRDPFFPPWTDVVQLDAFSPAFRGAARDTLDDIAEQADGVRCDMAMLALRHVFAGTWGERAGAPPAEDFWPGLTAATKRRHPGFLFVAEAYWGLNHQLLEQGFDYCYDKDLYDALVEGRPERVRAHLRGDTSAQRRTVRFLENHDEPRAAATFPPEAWRVLAVVAATVPGALLLHEGQADGRQVRVPVQLGRRPDERRDDGLADFYRRLLGFRAQARPGDDWHQLDVTGEHAAGMAAWSWTTSGRRHTVVVNLSPAPAAGDVHVDLDPSPAPVDLPPWGWRGGPSP